jgi:recombination protein RecR
LLPDRLRALIHLFARLPGVGERTAQRYALFLGLEAGSLADDLGAELVRLRELVRPCDRCGNLAEVGPEGSAICSVCADSRRDATLLCVVARVQDLLAVERSGAMRGRYFVLGKLLSPLDGIGPDELPLDRLLGLVKEDSVKEVIIATPPSVDGEATALLIAKELSAFGVSVSRIASGVPHGGDLEFSDQITLGRAISGRRAVNAGR